MKIGITAGSYIKTLGPEAGLARIRELGYDCLDFGYLANTDGELFQVSEGEFERRLQELLDTRYDGVLAAIRTTGKLEEATEETLKEALQVLLTEMGG